MLFWNTAFLEHVPVSSGRGGSGGIAAEKWFVGKIARKWLLNNDATMTSPECYDKNEKTRTRNLWWSEVWTET